MKLYTKILIFTLVLFFSFNSFAQNSGKTGTDPYEDIFLLAQKFDQSNSPKEAFIEYKRYLFLQDYAEGIHQQEACVALSLLYQKEEKFTKALEYLQLAQSYNQTTELQLKEIQLLQKYSQAKQPDLESNVNLYRYRFVEGYPQEVQISAWLVILENNVLRENFEKLEENLQTFYSKFPDSFTDEDKDSIAQAMENLKKFKPKSPMLAMHLSFIPGLGQLYAGQPLDALNAFLLNGSLIAISTWSIVSQNYLDFALFEINPVIRFYRGNLYNAQKEVYEYNSKKRKILKTPILEVLNKVEKTE